MTIKCCKGYWRGDGTERCFARNRLKSCRFCLLHIFIYIMKYVNYKNAKYALIDLHSIISYALTHLQFIMHNSLSDISLFLALPVMAKT